MVRELVRLQPVVHIPKLDNNRLVTATFFSNAAHSGVAEVYGKSGTLIEVNRWTVERTANHPIFRNPQSKTKLVTPREVLKYARLLRLTTVDSTLNGH